LFTLCEDPREREAYAAALSTFARHPVGNHLILTVRDDFLPSTYHLPALASLATNPETRFAPPPMAPREIRRVIEHPAAVVGLSFDEGVVDDLVKEVQGEPTALPLLQFTLRRLWSTRERNRITWASYRRVGTPRVALKRTADEVYEQLPQDLDKRVARLIFLDLVASTVGLEYLRRRVRRDFLRRHAGPATIDLVLDRFTSAGLLRVTPGEDAEDDRFEVSHEALLRNWPLLAEWVASDRTRTQERIRFRAAAELCRDKGWDPSLFLSGQLLDDASHYEDLDPLEREYIQRSDEACRLAEEAKEEARQRELEQAKRLADAEGEKATAEAQRANAETQRADAEAQRARAEKTRADAQAARALAEEERADALKAKAASELARTRFWKQAVAALAVMCLVTAVTSIVAVLSYQDAATTHKRAKDAAQEGEANARKEQKKLELALKERDEAQNVALVHEKKANTWATQASQLKDELIERFSDARPAIAICDDHIEGEPGPLWKAELQRKEQQIATICRATGVVAVTNHPSLKEVGTGFLVGRDLLLTASFVAVQFCRRDSDRWIIKTAPDGAPLKVIVDFSREECGTASAEFEIQDVLYVESVPGIALLRTQTLPLDRKPVFLPTEPPGADLVSRSVYTVGYLFPDGRLPQDVQDAILGRRPGIKRLSPGKILRFQETPIEVRKEAGVVGAVWSLEHGLQHDCTTMGGSGGSPLVDLATGQVIGLHVGGDLKTVKENTALPTWEIIQREILERFRAP
jgi:hypothetical protein